MIYTPVFLSYIFSVSLFHCLHQSQAKRSSAPTDSPSIDSLDAAALRTELKKLQDLLLDAGKPHGLTSRGRDPDDPEVDSVPHFPISDLPERHEIVEHDHLGLLQRSIGSPTNHHPGGVITVLKSPQLTNFGDWGEWRYCHFGDYVIGMTLRIEKSTEGDASTGLNAIFLQCQNLFGNSTYPIFSREGAMGETGKTALCPSNTTAIGFTLRSQPLTRVDLDGVGAVDFRLLCLGENGTVGDNWLRDERSEKEFRGYWTDNRICPKRSAICGIRTQHDEWTPNGPGVSADFTGLNNVNIACCEMEHPAETCREGEFIWKTLPPCPVEKPAQTLEPSLKIQYTDFLKGNIDTEKFYKAFGIDLRDKNKSIEALKNNIFFKKSSSDGIDYEVVLKETISQLKSLDGTNSSTSRLDNCGGDLIHPIAVLEMRCGYYTIQTTRTNSAQSSFYNIEAEHGLHQEKPEIHPN